MTTTVLRNAFAVPQRDFHRAALLIVLAALVLAESLPNALIAGRPVYGDFDFSVSGDRVIRASPEVARAGIRAGDRIDVRRTPLEGRTYTWGGALPRPNTTATFRVVHAGVARDVTLTATPYRPAPFDRFNFWEVALKKVATVVLVLTGVALALVRPSRVTIAFFLYTIGSAAAWPGYYSFLPAGLYVGLSALAFVGIAALAPVGFLIVALHLPADPPSGWRRVCDRAAPILALVLALHQIVPWVILGLGLGTGEEPFDLHLRSAVFLLGDLSLVGALLNSRLALGRGTRWAMGAFAAGTIPLFLSDGLFRIILRSGLSPGDLLSVIRDSALTINLLVSLLVAYMLVRYRIVDVRFVVDRSIVYGTVTLTIVIGFAALNLAFAKQPAGVAIVIPFEILGALALGYRLSGFNDVSTALALAGVLAPAAGIRGRRSEERELLARALERAERTRRADVIAEVRARAAFAAWCAGENDELNRHVAGLSAALGDRDSRGLAFFNAAASGGFDGRAPAAADLPDWAARAFLVACTSTADAALAREYAASALAAADAGGTPFLRVLARVAHAEFSPAERAKLHAEAAELACSTGSPELRKSLSAMMSAPADDAGFLAPFVARLRAPRQANPVLEISFLSVTVRYCGTSVTLRDSERALLFAIARDPEPTPAYRLADALWPELDGDAAANTLRVTLHRLRRSIGDAFSVVRSDRGFRLREGAVVDLWTLVEEVAAARSGAALSGTERERLAEIHGRLRGGRAARAKQGVWFARYATEVAEMTRDAALKLTRDALARGDGVEALRLARTMIEDDAGDELACELAMRAHLAAGDRRMAAREYRRYLGVLGLEERQRPAPSLESLLGSEPGDS